MAMTKKHHGVVIPMVTPFTARGELDENSARKIIDSLLDGGAHGVFVLGTTGEKASISLRTRFNLIRLAVEHVEGRALVYAGVSDDCLSNTLEAAEVSFRVGVHAVVAHPPCYYALRPDELIDYFTLLADSMKSPLLLYNIPTTTHTSIPPMVIARLSEHPNVVGLKDSENSEGRPEEIVRLVGGKDDFSLFMGASVLSAKALFIGMDGMVPSSGNLVPNYWYRMYEAAQKSEWPEVERIQSLVNRVAAVFQSNRTLGQSLAALKAALSTLGLCEPTMLPPLHTLSPAQIENIRGKLESLEGAGIGLLRPSVAQ